MFFLFFFREKRREGPARSQAANPASLTRGAWLTRGSLALLAAASRNVARHLARNAHELEALRTSAPLCAESRRGGRFTADKESRKRCLIGYKGKAVVAQNYRVDLKRERRRSAAKREKKSWLRSSVRARTKLRVSAEETILQIKRGYHARAAA